MAESRWEAKFAVDLRACGLPAPERHVRGLVPGRRFECDFVWRAAKVIVEVEGGSFVAGRHNQGATFRLDCEKYNLLGLRGWLVLRVTDEQVRTGDAIAWAAEALNRPLGLGLVDADD